MVSQEYSFSAVFLAFSPSCLIFCGALSRWVIFSARSFGFAGGVRMPVTLFVTISAAPPVFDAIIGFAHAMASMMVFPKGSPRLGKQKMVQFW